ncbi:MAG: ABC transporter ATP-binding protein [Promethearchaeota archaeon]
MNSWQIVLKYWLKSKKDFILSVLFQIISTLFSIMIPIFTGRLVGSLLKNPTLGEIWMWFSFVIIFSLLSFINSRIGRMKGARVSSRATFYMRRDINDTIYRQSFSYFDKNITGNLVAIATSDVEQTNRIFGFGVGNGLQAMVRMVGTYISAIVLGIITNIPQISIIFAIAIPIAMLTKVIIASKLKPIYLETRESFGQLTNTLYENIMGADIVRIFSKQDKENRKFYQNNLRFYNASIDSTKFSNMLAPVNSILTGILLIFSIFFCGGLFIQGLIEIEILIIFQSYIAQLLFPIRTFGQFLLAFMQGDAAFRRIREILEAIPDVTESPNPIPLKEIKGDVKFENVSFGYLTTHRILNDISFYIPSGKKCAIMGTTGSGKSTIINLLPRFYDVGLGQIKIDDIDIREYKLHDLRKNIGVVSQDSFLFYKSIRENIAYGKDNATDEEIISAAKIANLHDFILSLPNKYETLVGERGMRLSGGQKQRLSIARALIVQPKILIFDDSTSSVDVETEYKIQQALEKIMKNKTIFIITQRISTIRNVDIIIVLDKGRIVGFGNHFELIKSNVLYKQIYETLFRKQEDKTFSKIESTIIQSELQKK